MIVVDSNVILYSVLNNEHTEAAEAVMRKDSEWIAPPLWLSECRNVLMLYVRRGSLSVEDAIEIIEAADGNVQTFEFGPSTKNVLDLADISGCTARDFEFVAVAKQLNVPLVTSDNKVLSAFPTVAVSMLEFVGSASNN